MMPGWVLLLCFAGVNVGLAYAWWIAIRPALFQADLQAIRARLDATMKAERKTDDPRYLMLRTVITVLIDKAPYLSIPVITLSQRLRGGGEAGPDRMVEQARRLVVEGGNWLMQAEGIHPAVERARDDLLIRVLSHLALSPGNYLSLLLLLALGKTREVRSLLSMMLRGGRAIGFPLPTPTHAA